MVDHSQVVWRLDAQLAVGRPLRKQLWKQLGRGQDSGPGGQPAGRSTGARKLLALPARCDPAIPTNVEAQAARVYWANWRATANSKKWGPSVSAAIRTARTQRFLNYGYAVCGRPSRGRSVAAGLLPSLGIIIAIAATSFCLADDLIEPLRPLVDDRVRELHRQGYDELNQPAKAALLEILADRVTWATARRTSGR